MMPSWNFSVGCGNKNPLIICARLRVVPNWKQTLCLVPFAEMSNGRAGKAQPTGYGSCTCVVFCQTNWVSCLIRFLQRTDVLGGFLLHQRRCLLSCSPTATWQNQLGEESPSHVVCCSSSVCTPVPPLPPLYLCNLVLSVISLGFFVLMYVCIFLFLIFFFYFARGFSLPHLSFFFCCLNSFSIFHLEKFIKGDRESRGDGRKKFILYFCWCTSLVVWGGNQPNTTTANTQHIKKK